MGIGTHLITHGMSKLPEYKKWLAMRNRCINPVEVNHHGKGVSVCAEWQNDFPAFYDHIGPMPGPGYSVDRWPDWAGDYRPGNVRWATAKQQANNRSSNRLVVYRGSEMTFAEALDTAGNIVSQSTAWMRMKWGWEVDKAFDTPPRKGNYRRKRTDASHQTHQERQPD